MKWTALLWILGAGVASGAAPTAAQSLALGSPPAASAEDLTGRWALLQVMSARSDVPFVGDAYADTHALLLVDLRSEGDWVEGTMHMCALSIKAEPEIVRPVIPATFARSVPDTPLRGRVVRVGDRLHLQTERQLAVIGAKLDDPEKDALPDEPDDHRVHDTDGDGKPGMTMRVEGLFDIEFQLAQRQWNQLSGVVTGPGRVEGRVRHGVEQELLDADSILMQGLPDMIEAPERSHFVMVKLPVQADCKVAAQAISGSSGRESASRPKR